MSTSDQLARTAKALTDGWHTQGIDVAATEAEVIDSLTSLAASGFLDAEILPRVSIDVQVRLVVQAIKQFQISANIAASGALDRRTLLYVKRLWNCDASGPPSPLSTSVEAGFVYYFVSERFPS